MKKIVLSLLSVDMTAIIILGVVGWLCPSEAITIITQIVVACFLALVVVTCCIDELLMLAADLGQNLRHPNLNAVAIISGGTLLAIISASLLSSPFAASLGLLIELFTCLLAWQFGHQPHPDQLRHWNSRR